MSIWPETIIGALWRASWQASFLAVLVAVVLRVLGDWLTPRWRYLVWNVVLVRFLLIVVPSSSFSLFNLVPGLTNHQAPIVQQTQPTLVLNGNDTEAAAVVEVSSSIEAPMASPRTDVTHPFESAVDQHPAATDRRFHARVAVVTAAWWNRFTSAVTWSNCLMVTWLAGCVIFLVHLMMSIATLRRRLSTCRSVADEQILELLKSVCHSFGVIRIPQLLVTPAAISPCLIGIWRPRIVIPESMFTADSTESLRHVLVHEIAHLVRGDLWTNPLILGMRLVHWFNPLAWWTAREILAERECACDERAVEVLGQDNRTSYAATIVDLAAGLSASSFVPAMIGLNSTTLSVTRRVERLVRLPATRSIARPIVAVVLLGFALVGWTDAVPKTAANQGPAQEANDKQQPEDKLEPKLLTLQGRCLDYPGQTPLANVTVHLFRAQSRTMPLVEIAKSVTKADGQFEFADVEAPRPAEPADQLIYLLFATAEGRPIGMGGTWTLNESDPLLRTIHLLNESVTLKGTIRDGRGKPIADASVNQWDIDGRGAPGMLSAVTDADGHFEISHIPKFKSAFNFTISHPEFPQTKIEVADFSSALTITLPDGCKVTGTVIDTVLGKAGSRAIIEASSVENHSKFVAATDVDGKFQMVLSDGRYNFAAYRKDRIGVTLTDRECQVGENVKLPPLQLINGGWITGQLKNVKTGEIVALGNNGQPARIGLMTPTEPLGKTTTSTSRVALDAQGRFRLRAVPGDNYPFMWDVQADRMSWDTKNQPPVVVKEGETTVYDMLITPKISAAEKLKNAVELIQSFPKMPKERTARNIQELRKLNRSVDEEELWCSLLRDIVTIGRDAVPQLCEELDQTTDNVTVRRLAFALRAIGDTRAIPALIRAIPKSVFRSSSDYGLLVEDPQLLQFMQLHDHEPGKQGQYFFLGRSEREIVYTLHKLTGQDFDDDRIAGVSLSDDPRRQMQQRLFFTRHAQRWQTWWEAHWQEFVKDPAYQKVNLKGFEGAIPEPARLGESSQVINTLIGQVLSPPNQNGQFVVHFYDLDIGCQVKWPAQIARNETPATLEKLSKWAAEQGVDLMCITYRGSDGTETSILKSFGMQVREIDTRQNRNLDRTLKTGVLPEGREIGDLLMHIDPGTRQPAPDENAIFIYKTHEGNLGVIEIVDRITRTADLTGLPGKPAQGVGFHKGVQFNLKQIIP